MKLQKIFFLGIIAGIIFIGHALVTEAQAKAGNIKFPIAELGNCKNKTDCRQYCEKSENIAACTDFAEKNNMISDEEAESAKNLAESLKTGGPGGCKTQEACETYCEKTDNLEECVSYGESHGLMSGQEASEAKKVLQVLKQGGTTPGNCQGKKQCDAYCGDPNHSEECLNFAEKAGLIPPEELAMARKFMPAMARGETPGKCTSKDECESYCGNPDNAAECAAFGEKMGMMTHEQAEMMKKTKGKTPGNCKGREECENFCNKPENQETCFNFAKENGLIPEEEITKMKEGMGRLRAGIEQAPPEVVSCLKENLGQNIIEKIESGDFAPGPQIGESVKACFDKFMPKVQGDMKNSLDNAPAEVKSCLQEKIGSDGLEKLKSGEAPDPEMGDKMRECFEKMGPPQEGMMPQGSQQQNGQLSGPGTWPQMPEEMISCLKEKAGDSVMEKIQSGQMTSEIGEAMRECGEQFRPQQQEGQAPQLPPGEMMSPEGIPQDGTSAYPAPPSGEIVPPPGYYPAPPANNMPQESYSPQLPPSGEQPPLPSTDQYVPPPPPEQALPPSGETAPLPPVEQIPQEPQQQMPQESPQASAATTMVRHYIDQLIAKYILNT